MTAKNKRSKSTKKDGEINKNKNVVESSSKNIKEDAMKPFTKSQLASIAFLMAGISKIREFSKTLSDTNDVNEKCMDYLHHEPTCSHESFKSLVEVKYFSALSLAALVVTFVWQLWVSEYHFMKFMTCLCISPLFITNLIIMALNGGPEDGGHIDTTKSWHLCMVAAGLFGMVVPSSLEHLPFWSDSSSVKVKALSMQALALWGLFGAGIWEIVRVLFFHGGELQNALLQTSSDLPGPAKAIVYFWAVDKFSMVLLYAFALVHFPVFKQRAILLAAMLIKIYEYYMMLPTMREPWQDQEILNTITIGLAVTSCIGWLSP